MTRKVVCCFKMRLCSLLVILYTPVAIGYNVVRDTKYGKVKGEVKKSQVSDREFYLFSSIPYATPPVGNLRFQKPVPPKQWHDVKDVLLNPDMCTQLDKLAAGYNVKGSENCLYLKIAFPVATDGKLPVLVWIHGGTFLMGSTVTSGPDYFMEENVVLVQVQYRLNVFGFLSTQDQYASGNAGLKDQQLALKWVQENIAFFDGDPNKVTIFGSSAGSASVQHHMLAKNSWSLFHGAISQSGTALNRWSFQKDPLSSTKKLATAFGINTTDTKLLVHELQNVPADILLKTAFNNTVMGFRLPYTEQPFSVCIEKENESEFLTERALKLLEDGNFANVPYIIGYNTEEGSFPYTYIDHGDVDISIYDTFPELIVPSSMNIPFNSSCNRITLDTIKDFYFRNTALTNKSSWIKFMGNELFIRGIFKSVDLICKKMNIYLYTFSSVGHKWLNYDGGAPHYSEVLYLLYPQNSELWPSDETIEEAMTRKQLVRLWANFATFGNPTPLQDDLLNNTVWSKFCTDKSYLDIGTKLLIKYNPLSTDLKFWEQLFQNCGFPPYYTY